MPKIPQEFFDELGPERTAGMWAAPKAHGKLPEQSYDADPARLKAALRIMDACLMKGETVIDLGCMYGAYAIGFAQAGYRVTGIDARQQSITMAKQAARRAGVGWDQIQFICDDVRNLGQYHYSAAFCCGLLYHLPQPAAFLRLLGQITRRLLIVQTHIALQPVEEHEGYQGNWYIEGDLNHPFSAWGNTRSFWLVRDELVRAIQDAGFSLVMEVHDAKADIRGSADRVMIAAVKSRE